MKRSELLKVRKSLSKMGRDDLEEMCGVLIDSVLKSQREIKKAPASGKRRRRGVDPESSSEKFKMNELVWPIEVRKKYKKVFLHQVGNYIYARTKEYGTEKIVDKPISHYVWAVYTGQMPAKGRKFSHLDGNTMNNQYGNLHPVDGVYQ